MVKYCGYYVTAQEVPNEIIIEGKDVQTFTYAYVRLGDRDIAEGYVTQWRDYNNSDEVQVLVNGKYYLTHYSAGCRAGSLALVKERKF